MRKVTFLALLFGCAQTQTPFVLGPPSSALDGNTFQVVLDNGETRRAERLTFAVGQFSCAGCGEDNFKPAPYSTEVSRGSVEFKSQSVSFTDGTTNWTGTVRGGHIEGKLVWIDKQGRSRSYRFTGDSVGGGHVASAESRSQ